MERTLLMLVMHSLIKKRDIKTLFNCMDTCKNPPMNWKEIFWRLFPYFENDLPGYYDLEKAYSYFDLPYIETGEITVSETITCVNIKLNELRKRGIYREQIFWKHWILWVNASISTSLIYSRIVCGKKKIEDRENTKEEIFEAINNFTQYYNFGFISNFGESIRWPTLDFSLVRDLLFVLQGNKDFRNSAVDILNSSPPFFS